LKNPIAFGPLSEEIVEAVYRYSHHTHRSLMLIASKNQIDYSSGYVNNWTTSTYMSYIKEMRNKYADSDVLICRDHCGPGFAASTALDDTFKTIAEDIRRGFDLIHIDFCHYPGPRQGSLDKAAEAIKYAKRLNPSIRFEIGTDEIRQQLNLSQARKDIEYFLQLCKPEYFVINTGSHVLEDKQVGVFNQVATYQAKNLLSTYGLKLKEHNADYLTIEEIQQRNGLVDSLNIAPELGVKQTEKILSLANTYGISTDAFLSVSYESKKWKKWLQFTSPDDKYACAIFAGHYNFTSKEYLRLYHHLSEKLDVRETLINETIKVIDRYALNFN
jgi:hypothetical protein